MPTNSQVARAFATALLAARLTKLATEPQGNRYLGYVVNIRGEKPPANFPSDFDEMSAAFVHQSSLARILDFAIKDSQPPLIFFDPDDEGRSPSQDALTRLTAALEKMLELRNYDMILAFLPEDHPET